MPGIDEAGESLDPGGEIGFSNGSDGNDTGTAERTDSTTVTETSTETDGDTPTAAETKPSTATPTETPAAG